MLLWVSGRSIEAAEWLTAFRSHSHTAKCLFKKKEMMWTLNRWSATWGSPPHWRDFCTCAPIILSWTWESQPVAVRNSHCNGPVTWLHAAANGRALALKRPCTETHSHNHKETWHGLLAGWHSNLEASWPLLSLLPRLVSTVWLWKGHSLEPVSVSFFFPWCCVLYAVVGGCGAKIHGLSGWRACTLSSHYRNIFEGFRDFFFFFNHSQIKNLKTIHTHIQNDLTTPTILHLHWQSNTFTQI